MGKRLKKDLSSRLVRIIGFAVDTPGFIVVLEDDDGKIRPTSHIIATVHVQPSRARQLWTTDGAGVPVPPPPVDLRTDYIPLRRPGEAISSVSDDDAPGQRAAPFGVGTSPGHCGSRFNLSSVPSSLRLVGPRRHRVLSWTNMRLRSLFEKPRQLESPFASCNRTRSLANWRLIMRRIRA